MGNSSEEGACTINVDSYKCSIKKITVSTKWKAPTAEVPDTATATVFDSKSGKSGKTIYLVSSPEGKTIKLKTVREGGQCQRDNHKKYVISREDSSLGNLNFGMSLGNNKGVNNTSTQSSDKSADKPEEKDINNEEDLSIKCFKIGGKLDSFKYLSLPLPTLKSYVTTFKYNSCTEGSFQYRIISYPDLSFRLEGSIGTEAKKYRNNTSPFEKKTANLNYVKSQLQDLNDEKTMEAELKFSPSLSAKTTYNGGKSELELIINFDSKKEIVQFKYKHDSTVVDLGSELIQELTGAGKKFVDLFKLLKKICTIDFIKEFVAFDATKLVKNYKPYKLSLAPPNVLVCYEGKYHVSKDLTRIGKYYDLGVATKPFIKISFKIDLLFLILNVVSGGTATGFYVMLKNLDKVIGKILGNSYKKTYKDTKPFKADIYFNFIISGAVNGSIHWIRDSLQKQNPNTFSGSIEGVLAVDLEAGAVCKLDILIVAVEAEVSASASSGIKVVEKFVNQMMKDGALVLSTEIIFMGLKLKYCVTGKVGLMRTTSYGRNLLDGNPTLMKESTLLSHQDLFF